MKKLNYIQAASNNNDDESIVTPLLDQIKDKINYVTLGIEMLEFDGQHDEAAALASDLLDALDSLQVRIADIQVEDE